MTASVFVKCFPCSPGIGEGQRKERVCRGSYEAVQCGIRVWKEERKKEREKEKRYKRENKTVIRCLHLDRRNGVRD